VRKISNAVFDGDSLDLPPDGLSLTNCVLRNVAWTGSRTEAFFARGCIIESSDFRRVSFAGGYFGGGETAGLRQTVYRGCVFDQANLEGASFGSARFERCSFRDVRLRKWLSFSAEFIDCVFAGDIPEAAFLGRSPSLTAARKRNEFRGNDFTQAQFGQVEFRGGIDLFLQRLPVGEGEVILDQRAERIARALAIIESWPDKDRESARRYLRIYSGSRYDGQEHLYLQMRPSPLISAALRDRVIGILMNCIPTSSAQ
jgi:hypothetical protein